MLRVLWAVCISKEQIKEDSVALHEVLFVCKELVTSTWLVTSGGH